MNLFVAHRLLDIPSPQTRHATCCIYMPLVKRAIIAARRYLIEISVIFPFGTLAVNVAGSFLIGAVFVMLSSKGVD